MGLEATPLLVGIVACRGKVAIILALWPFRACCIDLACIKTGAGFGVLQQIMGRGDGLEACLGPRIVRVQLGWLVRTSLR